MIKRIFFFIFLLILVGSFFTVNAKNSDIPEKDGTYNDPDYPGVKVRVFVHRIKSEKGKPTPPNPLICQLSDPESSGQVAAEKWLLPIQWTYNLNFDSVPSTVGKDNLTTMAKNDFERWSQASGNRVIFTKGNNSTVNRQSLDYQNVIAWGRTSGTALAVTYVRYYPDNNLVVDVDTIMNNKFPWSWSNSMTCAYQNSYDAENILTHELGHWIGLDDMYELSYQDATMYGYGSKMEVKKTTLTDGDKIGAYTIYNQ